MIRKKKKESGPIVIDLTGPQGNVFSLMNNAFKIGHKIGKSEKEINTIVENMMSDDYENAIQVFDEAFGEYIILER